MLDDPVEIDRPADVRAGHVHRDLDATRVQPAVDAALNPQLRDGPEDTLLLDDLRIVLNRRAKTDAFVSTSENLQGTQVGQYVVGELLGQGGMAQVYRANDLEHGTDIALKVLKPQYRADAALCARLEREARSMARLQHENVVRILGFPRNDLFSAIAMELLPGGNLRARLVAHEAAGTDPPIEEAVRWIRQAAGGIGAAHATGMVHRDVKPYNLLLDAADNVKVADFGAILVLEQTTWLTGVGQQIGTPGYMSPEQCKGERVTPASDVYSLGATLFELLTGRLPFIVEEASPFAMMLKHLSEPPPDPRMCRDDVPDWLATIILKCLDKRPTSRFATGAELAIALKMGPQLESTRPPVEPKSAGGSVDIATIRQQLQQLPQRAIACWACRCARRVQRLNPDPRVERALDMAESAVFAIKAGAPESLSQALSRVHSLRLASLKAAYTDDTTMASPEATEAARAAAAAASCAAARCIDDAAADAAFAARSAIAALEHAGEPVRDFWVTARQDFQRLRGASLGPAGTIGLPIPQSLFD